MSRPLVTISWAPDYCRRCGMVVRRVRRGMLHGLADRAGSLTCPGGAHPHTVTYAPTTGR